MTQGSPISQAKKDKFRAEYLLSLNASEAARKVGLPESTGRDLAVKLRKEADFSETRRRLRAEQLDELVTLRMDVARKAKERFEGDLEGEDQAGSGKNVTIIDKRADYGRLVMDAEKNAHNLAKIDREAEGGEVSTTRDVRITLVASGDESE